MWQAEVAESTPNLVIICCVPGSRMVLDAATIAASQSPLRRAATAICRANMDEEQAVSMVTLLNIDTYSLVSQHSCH